MQKGVQFEKKLRRKSINLFFSKCFSNIEILLSLECVVRGVNRGMQIRRSVVFLGPIRRSDLIFVQIRIRVTLKIFRGI